MSDERNHLTKRDLEIIAKQLQSTFGEPDDPNTSKPEPQDENED